MDKILIVGSNSFSGASFAEFLLAKGNSVIGVSRSPEPSSVFLPYKWHEYKKFSFHILDINQNLDEMMDLICSERPSYIVNFAAQSMVGESWNTPSDWFMTNTLSTIKFHDQLRKCSFLRRYVHISTPEVYGSCSGFVDESFPFNPSTPYAVSRAAADMSLSTFRKAYNFPFVITRAANVYGPGQQLYRIIPRTILFIMLGMKLKLHGGGSSSRSFIHISDVCDATWRLMENGVDGATYHISTSEVISIRDLVERICMMLGVDFEDVVEFTNDRVGKDSAYHLDSSKIQANIGWKSNISLESGLMECISWVKRNIDDLKNQPFDYHHKK